MKMGEPVQLQTVLPRNWSRSSNAKLSNIEDHVKNIDQMIRRRNFKARNERIETGVMVKSHGWRKVSVERKVGECLQWKATWQWSRRGSCSFSHGSHRGQQAQSSPDPQAQTQMDGRRPSEGFGARGQSPSGLKGQKACTNVVKGTWTDPSCDYWHPACQKLQACMGMQIRRPMSIQTHWRWWTAPYKKSKKWVETDQLLHWRSLFNWVGSNHAVIFSNGTWHHVKIRERKSPSQGILQKCEPQERNPRAPKFEDRTLQKTLQKERCALGEAWGLAKKCLQAQKMRIRLRFTLQMKHRWCQHPLRKSQRNENSG